MVDVLGDGKGWNPGTVWLGFPSAQASHVALREASFIIVLDAFNGLDPVPFFGADFISAPWAQHFISSRFFQ
jgi:hypothetical protein